MLAFRVFPTLLLFHTHTHTHTQDGPLPSEGTVISELGGDGWVRVKWDSGTVNSYRMGKEDKYDIDLAPSELVPKNKEGEAKEEPADIELTTGEDQA